jgi:hypothetical protein
MESRDIKYVYKLKCGKFYKDTGMASTQVNSRVVSNLSEATLYTKDNSFSMETPPYYDNALLGGEWVKVLVVRTVI